MIYIQTPYNYHRALVWTAVMTTLSHLDSNFGSVFAIEAVNEPIMDASKTPNYGTCVYYTSFSIRTLILLDTVQKNFVATVRAVELVLGIDVPFMTLDVSASVSNNFTAALSAACSSTIFTPEVQSALADAVPILLEIGVQYELQTVLEASSFRKQSNSPLTTK
jgi:glucan endo-1,6-beta-glucosidase